MIDVGAVLSGRFALRASLGVDGVATVWDAQDTVLDRRVLISVLRSELADDSVEVERFQREMRAAARADSTSGARVLDAGEDLATRLPFVVFEWRPPQPQATVQPRPATPGPRQTPAPSAGGPLPVGPSGQRRPGTPASPAPTGPPGERAVPRWLEHPKPARRVAPRGPARGRSGRALQGLVLVLILVPLAVGALLIRNFLQQPSPVPSQLFSLASGAPGTPTLAASTAAVSQPATPRVPATAVAAATALPVQAAPPTAVQRAATPAPAAPAVASAPARATPAASPIYAGGERRRVANTDGQGVALRATPGGDRLAGKGYDEGTTVTLLEVQGTWAHIRGDDGREGWVLAVTLVP